MRDCLQLHKRLSTMHFWLWRFQLRYWFVTLCCRVTHKHTFSASSSLSICCFFELTSDDFVIAIEHNLIAQFYPKSILRNLKWLCLENDATLWLLLVNSRLKCIKSDRFGSKLPLLEMAIRCESLLLGLAIRPQSTAPAAITLINSPDDLFYFQFFFFRHLFMKFKILPLTLKSKGSCSRNLLFTTSILLPMVSYFTTNSKQLSNRQCLKSLVSFLDQDIEGLIINLWSKKIFFCHSWISLRDESS